MSYDQAVSNQLGKRLWWLAEIAFIEQYDNCLVVNRRDGMRIPFRTDDKERLFPKFPTIIKSGCYN